MAGGTSDRRWLKAHLINGLTYLLIRVVGVQVFSAATKTRKNN